MIGLIQPRADGRRLALAGLGRLLRPPAPTASSRARILVVRPDHLGDLLVLTPALARLRRAYPTAEIVGLVGPWGVPVLATNPNLDRLIAWDFPWFDRRPRRSLTAPYLSLLDLSRVLRSEAFDLAIQFRPDFWWGALAVRLAGIPEQVGYDVPTVRAFLTRAVPIVHRGHAADDNLRLVENLVTADRRRGDDPRAASRVVPEGSEVPTAAGGGGGKPMASGSLDAPRLEFHPTAADRARADTLLGPPDGRALVAIQTGAGAPVKLWPVERLAAVGRALVERFRVRLVIVGGAAERDLVEQVARGVGGDAIRLAGITSLGELGAVLERCALVVGPDSGPLHLAVAVGTPTVHLYGPADPTRFGPYGSAERHRVVQSPWPCCPCDQLAFSADELPLHACMARLEVEPVVAAASDLLQHATGRS